MESIERLRRFRVLQAFRFGAISIRQAAFQPKEGCRKHGRYQVDTALTHHARMPPIEVEGLNMPDMEKFKKSFDYETRCEWAEATARWRQKHLTQDESCAPEVRKHGRDEYSPTTRMRHISELIDECLSDLTTRINARMEGGDGEDIDESPHSSRSSMDKSMDK